ncbi:MAG TPA: hypothetical protein VJK26_01830 [Patescibacteria group bacterium]|nr:hypothetical protein [Patescibacteria group bacterium]
MKQAKRGFIIIKVLQGIVLSLLLTSVLSFNFAGKVVPKAEAQTAQWIGKTPAMSGETYQVAIAGNYVYTTSSLGFHIADVSTPSKILVKSFFDSTIFLAIAVSGNYAYVGADKNFKVFQVTDPANPVVAGSLTLGEAINGITISGTKAYVSIGTLGLAIINISNPAAPSVLGTLNTPNFARASAITGTTAVIADTTGVITADVSNSASPRVLGTLAAAVAMDVSLSGSYAYVADANISTGGLLVVSIANPSSPQLVNRVITRGAASGLTVLGSYLFMTEYSGITTNNGLEIFNLSNPALPQSASFVALTGFLRGRPAVVSGFAVVASGQGGLVTINITNPSSPSVLGRLGKVINVPAVAISGSYLYAVNNVSSGNKADIWIYNISQPNAPVHIATFTLGAVNDLTIEGNYLYATDNQTLKIINIQNPLSPTLTGTLNLPDSGYGVTVASGKAYIADYLAGLVIANVSNPAAPSILGQLDTPGQAFSVAVSGNTAIVADGSGTSTGAVQSIDVANAAAPRILSSFTTANFANDVVISGNLAYVAARTAGLYILNISNPSALQQVSRTVTKDSAFGVYVSGTSAYVAISSNTTKGLQIFNVSNPAAPQETAFLTLPYPGGVVGVVRAVTASGGYAFLTDDNYLIDIASVGTTPTPLQLVKTGPSSVSRGGTIAYTLTITNPTSQTMTALSLADAVPAGSTYVSGQTKVNGSTVTEAAGDDSFTLNNNVLYFSGFQFQSIAPTGQPGSTITVTFQVTAN